MLWSSLKVKTPQSPRAVHVFSNSLETHCGFSYSPSLSFWFVHPSSLSIRDADRLEKFRPTDAFWMYESSCLPFTIQSTTFSKNTTGTVAAQELHLEVFGVHLFLSKSFTHSLELQHFWFSPCASSRRRSRSSSSLCPRATAPLMWLKKRPVLSADFMSKARKAALYQSLPENNICSSANQARENWLFHCLQEHAGSQGQKKRNKGVNIKKKDVRRMPDPRLSA